MMLLSFAVALCLQAEDTVAYGNALVRVPEGWKAEIKDEGLFLVPGDLRKNESFVVILPQGGLADVNLAAGFERTWKQAAGKRTVATKAPEKEIKTDGGVDGLLSVGLLDDAGDDRLIAAVALFKPADRFQAVLALTREDHVYQRYSEAFRVLWKGLRFRNIELPTYDLLLSMGYTVKEGKTSVYVLFKDGTWLPFLPSEGLDGMDGAAARKKHERDCGTHESKDGVLTLRAGSRVETLRALQDGGYRSTENAVFQPVKTSTGIRLDGRFELHGGTQALVFKPDATFSEEGKAGTYEVYNNTLFLNDAKTGLKKVSFVALPAAKLEFLLIDSKWFRRP